MSPVRTSDSLAERVGFEPLVPLRRDWPKPRLQGGLKGTGRACSSATSGDRFLELDFEPLFGRRYTLHRRRPDVGARLRMALSLEAVARKSAVPRTRGTSGSTFLRYFKDDYIYFTIT